MSDSDDGVLPDADDGVLPDVGDGVLPAAGDGVLPAAGDGVLPAAGDGVLPAAGDGVLPAAGDGVDEYGVDQTSLETAMISYAYNFGGMLYRQCTWNEFKMYFQCDLTPAQLFDEFWDKIMPAINAKTEPAVARQLQMIHNPRTFPPPAPKTYECIREISSFDFKRQQLVISERKGFNDPKVLELKTSCTRYVDQLREEQRTQSETNQASTSRGISGVPNIEVTSRASPGLTSSTLGVPNIDGTSRASPGLTSSTLGVPNIDGTSRASHGTSLPMIAQSPQRSDDL